MAEPLRYEFCFENPYDGAKYSLVVPVDFSNQKLVPSETEHPHKRFVRRKVRKWFYVDDITKKQLSKSFAGVVLSYSQKGSYSRSCTKLTMTKRIWTSTS